VGVNSAIRVRDPESCPSAQDLITVLDHDLREQPAGLLFALVFDISKAHRRIAIQERDWGFIGCSLLPRGQAPSDQAEVWVNTVGTYGLGCASYWWARLGSLLQRLALYVTPRLRWCVRFADDYILTARAPHQWQPLLATLVLLRALGVPLEWSKLHGGADIDWIGYNIKLDVATIGVSEQRAAWAARWCEEQATTTHVRIHTSKKGLGGWRSQWKCCDGKTPFLAPSSAWTQRWPRLQWSASP
jgi:hypothetical protein